MKKLNLENFELRELKSEGISQNELTVLTGLTGDVSSLFSKSSNKYKELGLKNQTLSDSQMKDFILGHYTFLKRPIMIVDKEIFIGNSTDVVEKMINKIK